MALLAILSVVMLELAMELVVIADGTVVIIPLLSILRHCRLLCVFWKEKSSDEED